MVSQTSRTGSRSLRRRALRGALLGVAAALLALVWRAATGARVARDERRDPPLGLLVVDGQRRHPRGPDAGPRDLPGGRPRRCPRDPDLRGPWPGGSLHPLPRRGVGGDAGAHRVRGRAPRAGRRRDLRHRLELRRPPRGPLGRCGAPGDRVVRPGRGPAPLSADRAPGKGGPVPTRRARRLRGRRSDRGPHRAGRRAGSPRLDAARWDLASLRALRRALRSEGRARGARRRGLPPRLPLRAGARALPRPLRRRVRPPPGPRRPRLLQRLLRGPRRELDERLLRGVRGTAGLRPAAAPSCPCRRGRRRRDGAGQVRRPRDDLGPAARALRPPLGGLGPPAAGA